MVSSGVRPSIGDNYVVYAANVFKVREYGVKYGSHITYFCVKHLVYAVTCTSSRSDRTLPKSAEV